MGLKYGINPQSVTLLEGAGYARALVGPVTEDLVQKALARGVGPVKTVVDVTAKVAVQAAPQVMSQPGDARTKLIRMAALVGGATVTAAWAAWKFRPVDAPPHGMETSEWTAELTEDEHLMREVAAKYIELSLAELLGFAARFMQLRDELVALSTQISNRVYALPLLKRPLQAQASYPGDADQFGLYGLPLDEKGREDLLREMVDDGWQRRDALMAIASFVALQGPRKDDDGTYLLLAFFRDLRAAGFSATDQAQMLNQIQLRYETVFETWILMKKINDVRTILSRFEAWTPALQTRLLLAVIQNSPQPVDALAVVHLACTQLSPGEFKRLFDELQQAGYKGDELYMRHQDLLIEQGPASWPPQDLIATIGVVRQTHGSLNTYSVPLGTIYASRIVVH